MLQEGLDSGIITKEEFNSLNPEEKNPANLYCNFQVHKAHAYKEAPPVKPIVSGTGSITEGVTTFVEHFIKYISTINKQGN